MSIPIPPDPWVVTTTNKDTHLLPDASMVAFDGRYRKPGDPVTDDELPARLGEAELSASIAGFNRPSIMLRDRLTAGATPAQNRSDYQAAIESAQTFGMALCYDGAFFTFEGDPVRSTADDFVHWATGWDTHLVVQQSRGYAVLLVQGERSLCDGLHFDGANPLLEDIATVSSGWLSAGIVVDPTAHDSTVRRFRAGGFMRQVFSLLRPWDEFVLAPTTPDPTTITEEAYPALRNLTVEDIYCDGCWTAFQPIAPDGCTIRRINGWYQERPGDTDAAHLVYVQAFATSDTVIYRWCYNVTIDDCLATASVGSSTRHAYRARGVKGLSVSRLRATDTNGLFQWISCEDVQIGDGCVSLRDTLVTSDGSGSASLLRCKRGYQAPVTVQFAGGWNSAGGSLIACEDFDVDRVRVVHNNTATNANMMYRVAGVNPGCRVIEPDLYSAGAETIAIGLSLYSTSLQPGDSQVVVENPRIRGNVIDGGRISHAGATVTYHPDRVEATARKMRVDANPSVTLVNLATPTRPDMDSSILAWHNGEAVNSSGTLEVGERWPDGTWRATMSGAWRGNGRGRLTAQSASMVCTTMNSAADIDASCKVRSGSAYRAGLALRANSNTDTLALTVRDGFIELLKYVSGTVTVLASAAITFPVVGAFAQLRALTVGTRVVGFLNGVELINHTLSGGDDTTYVSTAHGLYATQGSSNYTNTAWETPVFRAIS